MTRAFTASLSLALLVGLLAFDMATTPPNAYRAPPVLALGSGQTASGGFCGALPE